MHLKKNLFLELGFVFFGIFVFFVVQISGLTQTIENFFIDYRYGIKTRVSADSNILIVNISDRTLQKMQSNWPIERKYYLEFLKKISPNSPQVIAFDLLFLEKEHQQSQIEEQVSQYIIDNNLNVVLASKLEEKTTNINLPNTFLQSKIHYKPEINLRKSTDFGFINLPCERDEKVRKYLFWDHHLEQKIPSFALKIFQSVFHDDSILLYNKIKPYSYLRFAHPLQGFEEIDFIDILNGNFSMEEIQNRIILVGVNLKESKDFFHTPLSQETHQMYSGIYIQACALNMLLNELEIDKIDSIITWLAYLLILGLLIVVWLKKRPFLSFILTFSILIMIFSLSILLFVYFDILIDTLNGFFMISSCYLFFFSGKFIQYSLENQRLVRELSEQKITLEKTLEQLSTTQDEKIRMERLFVIGKMANFVLHDIKRPLHNMNFSLDLLKRENNLSYDKIEAYQDLLEEIQQIENLIQDVADYSKKDIHLNLQTIMIEEYFHHLFEKACPLIENKKVSFKLNVSHEVQTITGDPTRLQRVFLNLIQNAIESIQSSGNIIISIQQEPKWIKITVFNDGEKMSEKIKNKIFEPFITDKATGTGLGLAIVDQIIRSHQGEITINDEVKQGTEFVIWLPDRRETFNHKETQRRHGEH